MVQTASGTKNIVKLFWPKVQCDNMLPCMTSFKNEDMTLLSLHRLVYLWEINCLPDQQPIAHIPCKQRAGNQSEVFSNQRDQIVNREVVETKSRGEGM